MEKFFRRVRYWFHHQKKIFERHVAASPSLSNIFASKNLRLAIILVIALAIPLTVLAVQQIQDIRQQAANEPLCSGQYVVSPQPALQDQQVTFSLASGATVDNNINGFGNGVYADTCQQNGASVTCKVRGNFNASDPTGTIKKSTWFILEGGAEKNLCQYQIQRVRAEPTRGPTQPPPPAGGACTGTITASCDFANKPVFTITWDLRGSTAPCKVDVKGKASSYTNNQSTKCESKSNVKISGGQIANGDYELVLSKAGAQCFTTTAKANCSGAGSTGGTPTPTQKPGQTTPTATLAPGQPTNTPAPQTGTTCKNTDVHLDKGGGPTAQSFCSTGGNIELKGGWKLSGTKCKVTLYEDGKAVSDDDKCVRDSWSTTTYDGKKLTAGKIYQLKATSDACTNEKLESEIVEATVCAGPATPTPTRTPTAPTPTSAQTVCPTPASGEGIGAGTFSPNCVTPTPRLAGPGRPI